MNKVIHKSTGIVFGLTLALFVGRPALADDTELLVVTPPDPSQVKPNVMFVLDTSGSMSSVQIFGELYSQETDYSEFGECDKSYLYYTEAHSTMPECGDTNTRLIRKEAWNCLAASAPISNVGEYTGVLAQYRPSITTIDGDGLEALIGPNQWQPLEPGNESGDVECEADRGKHGSFDLRATIDVYATNALDPDGDGWTSDSSQEVSWGSSGVNVTYTVYDGNYLNYLKDPATRYLSRSAVMKEVVTTVLNSAANMNVGLMRFNGENGGTVIQAPVDLDTNRAEILARVDSLDSNDFTPLAESFFESALLWQGLPAHYGELYDEHTTDPKALASSNPEIYARPEIRSCAKNFNVLLSDGEPSRDADVPELLGQLPGYAAVMGSLGCTGTGDGACLSDVDVAEYLSRVDIDPTLDGQQSVITHAIGFTQNIPILEETARRGGGQYLLAEDTDSLLQALSTVVSQINHISRCLARAARPTGRATSSITASVTARSLTLGALKRSTRKPDSSMTPRARTGPLAQQMAMTYCAGGPLTSSLTRACVACSPITASTTACRVPLTPSPPLTSAHFPPRTLVSRPARIPRSKR
jgi:type IV pilus assembly protein PilY1